MACSINNNSGFESVLDNFSLVDLHQERSLELGIVILKSEP